MGAREGALGRDPVVWAVQVVLVLWCLPALLLVLALGLILIAVEAGARWTAAVIRRVVPRGRRMGAAPPRPPRPDAILEPCLPSPEFLSAEPESYWDDVGVPGQGIVVLNSDGSGSGVATCDDTSA